MAGAFTCKYFYTAIFILCMFLFTYMHALSQGYFQSYMLLYRDVFTQRHLCTEMLLHRDAFTHRHDFLRTYFYREMILHRAILHTNAKTNRATFTKGMCQHEEFLPTGIFTQTYYCMISDGGHAYGAKELSKHVQSHTFTTAFDVRDAYHGTGLAQRKPTLHFDLNV